MNMLSSPLIPQAVVGNKQDTELTSRGKCRTVSGGFFSS